MADSTTWLETVATAQSQKEVTVNDLFDAHSPASAFGRHAELCSDLTWAYYGGRVWDGTAALLVVNGTLTLTNNATNYIEADTGSPFAQVTANTSGFTAGSIRIAKVTTSGGSVTAYEDHRTFTFPGSAAAGFVTSVALSVPAEFSVSGSPITSSGTLAVSKATQSANRVWAGPTSGSAAQPSFRALVAADIPDLPAFVGDDGGSPNSGVKGQVPAPNQGDASKYLRGDGSWVIQPYDVGGAVSGVPSASAVLIRYPFPRTVIFPASLTLSRGVAAIAATAQTDFDLQKNGSSFGTMRFAAAGTTASFIAASQTTFSAGDILTVVAPASPDATLASVGFALAGTRT